MLELNFKDAVGLDAYASGHMETMGQRIRRLRLARGWNQEQLGDRIGVTLSTISQYELDTTKNPKIVHLLAMAEVFDTEVYYLVFGPPQPGEPRTKRALSFLDKHRSKKD